VNLSPYTPDAFAPIRAAIRADLSAIQRHLLAALRVNAHGAHERRPDGSLWRSVRFADADLDGVGQRAADHFATLRAAGLFEPVGIAGGNVLISHPAEVRP
jgi:hypothetical protein